MFSTVAESDENKVFTPVKVAETINVLESRIDFNEFCSRMRTKWYSRNEPTKDFSKNPAFSLISTWTPPNGHPKS